MDAFRIGGYGADRGVCVDVFGAWPHGCHHTLTRLPKRLFALVRLFCDGRGGGVLARAWVMPVTSLACSGLASRQC